MWNLSGNDIQRAKDEIIGRRAAIQARYDSEMKEVEADLARIETFERAAVDFVASFKGDEAAPAAEPPPAAPPAADAAASGESSPASGEIPAEASAEAEKAAAAKGSSRWRMRLGAAEGAS
jgi:hypothetical protein